MTTEQQSMHKIERRKAQGEEEPTSKDPEVWQQREYCSYKSRRDNMIISSDKQLNKSCSFLQNYLNIRITVP